MALSRNEEILQSKIDGTSYDKPPLSRIEELLIQLPTGGGGGGSGEGGYYPPGGEFDFDDSDIDDIFDDISSDNDQNAPSDYREENDLGTDEVDDIMSAISTNND